MTSEKQRICEAEGHLPRNTYDIGLAFGGGAVDFYCPRCQRLLDTVVIRDLTADEAREVAAFVMQMEPGGKP